MLKRFYTNTFFCKFDVIFSFLYNFSPTKIFFFLTNTEQLYYIVLFVTGGGYVMINSVSRVPEFSGVKIKKIFPISTWNVC